MALKPEPSGHFTSVITASITLLVGTTLPKSGYNHSAGTDSEIRFGKRDGMWCQ